MGHQLGGGGRNGCMAASVGGRTCNSLLVMITISLLKTK